MSHEIERSTLGKRLAAHRIAEEVTRRMKEGETPLAVAEWLQEDLLLFTEAKVEELELAVREHFLTEVPLEERLAIQREGRKSIVATVAKQRQRLNAKQRLEILSDLQFGRIELMHAMEDATGVLMGSGANEIEIARRIAVNIHEVSKDTGQDDAPRGPEGGLDSKISRVLLSLMRERQAQEKVEVEVIDKPDEDVEDAEFSEVKDG